MSNKFDDNKIKAVELIKLDLDDIDALMSSKYEVELKDNLYCGNCKHIFSVYDIYYDDYRECPHCKTRSDIYSCYQDDITESNVADLEDELGKDGVKRILDIFKKEEGVVKVEENNKINLQEATIKALYDGLKDDTEVSDVEGIISDVLVVTDPEITTEEYNEVIERAEEIIEDTPEGEIPLDTTYLGEYLQICPICGGSFIEDHILEPGTACPICFETPESFVMIGKLESEDKVAEDNGLVDEDGDTIETDIEVTPMETDENEDINVEIGEEETIEREVPERTETPEITNRPRGARARLNRRDVASKEIPQGNVLVESKLEEADELEEVEKEWELIEADDDKIIELENGSAFTWEGMLISDENLQDIVESFKEETPIILPVKFYTFTGAKMNELYGLTEKNAYPEDLHFLSIDLDNWSSMGNLPIFKMQVGARWLDDIVDNNKVRQDKIDGVETDEDEEM